MNDEIAKKFDQEWTPHVVHPTSVETVRSWLKKQHEDDIRLYLGIFQETLKKDHPARAQLLQEELERRAKPLPNRVEQTFEYLRSKWLIAITIVLATTFVSFVSVREALCEVLPFICVQDERTIGDIFGDK